MGTISEKLTYLNTTKQKIKQSINNIGGNITNNTTFRNYATELDAIYNKLSKVKATGDKLSLNPTVGGKLEIVPKGNTYQSSVTLPSGYTQVDYLESNGRQYIDTGYAFENPDLKIEGKYRKTYLNGNVFGVDTSTSGSRQMHGNIYAKALYLGNSSVVSDITQELDTDYNFSFQFKNNVATWIINDDIYTYQGNNGWEGTNITSALFATNKSTTFSPSFSLKGRIYYAKFYDNNDNLVRDFIPCYRNSDNEVGMYDLVNDVFYTNKGTGEFTYGNVASTYNINVATDNNTVKIIGKNLFDKNTITTGAYISDTGEIKSNKNFAISDFISVIPNDVYTYSGTHIKSSYGGKIGFYDKNKNWISSLPLNLSETFVVPNNAYYFRASLQISQNDQNTFQLEKGSQVTSYEQYKSQNYPINLGTMELCKIGNYEDYIYGTPDNWIKEKVIEKISSYNGETITTDYISTTGGLDTGATVYYVLQTPTEVSITNTTLIEQLNNIYNNAYAYEGTTNIFTSCEEGNVPTIIEASALKGI